jgi:putative nucleotidyltransferase with HDIG domain
VRVPVLRLTFLARFTIVTLIVTILSALVLTVVLERAHRAAIESDVEAAAIGHISAELSQPLGKLAALPHATAEIERTFWRAENDAKLFEYVSAMRVYAHDGNPVYPRDTAAAPDAVRQAIASDAFYRTKSSDTITVYAPCYADNAVYVIAVDFVRGQLSAAYARERDRLLGAVALVSSITFVSLLALAAGASRELERRRREAQSSFVQTLSIMADVIDLRDPYTAGHSKRVAVYARQLATAIALPPRQIDVIENGALLHDIGKIAIPDAVLFKPAALDAEERLIIGAHPVVGARLLGGISAMQDVVPCVLHHHEKLDGTGYPDHLCGEAIPLGARVVAVADTFDAMTTDRPYRRALTAETAIAELVRVAGTQLDERLVLKFCELVVRGDIVPPPSLADLESMTEVAAQTRSQSDSRDPAHAVRHP